MKFYPLSNIYFKYKFNKVFSLFLTSFIPIAYASEYQSTKDIDDTQTLDTITVISNKNINNYIQSLGITFNPNLYPAQITIINQQTLNNLQANTLADAIKQDTSVNQNYAPLGYQENFSIRGLALNLDSSYLLNGIPTSNRQIANLANKEQIQIIKGINSLENSAINGGGAINYVTKRPKNINNINVHTQSIGQYGISLDVGRKFNFNDSENQIGYRINLDYTKLKPYVKTASGEQSLASIALDGKMKNLAWQFDADYQSHKQYTVPGYQLLDNINIPQNISPKTMLNNPIWRKPTDTKSYNIGTKLEYNLNSQWKINSSLQHSITKIDDYVAFPYSFQANGDYKLADYQSPDQTYTNNYFDISLNGKFNTYNLQHALSFGLTQLWFEKSGKDSITAGKELRNIYNPQIILSPYKQGQILGNTYTQLKHQQQNIFLRDAVNWQDITLFLNARLAKMNEQAFNITNQIATINKNILLPNLGLSYNIKPNFSTYIQYSKNIEIGRDTNIINYNSSYLPARLVKQIEVGFNYIYNKNTKLQGAIFTTSRPYEYINSEYIFVQDGIEKRKGIEINSTSKLNKFTTVGLGATYYLQANQINTKIASYNEASALNIPKLQTNIWLEYQMPQFKYLTFISNWHFSQAKPANQQASVKIPAYNTMDIGLRFAKKINNNKFNINFAIDNIFNKTYWKDAGEAFGENYIHLGAPRVYKANLSIDF